MKADNYLQEQLKTIEKSNQDNFTDPFFKLYFEMQDFDRDYFSEESMMDYTVELTILFQNLDYIMERLDDISYHYNEAEADHYKWRKNSFERAVYKALSKEANIIAAMIVQMIHEFEQMSTEGIDYDGMVELKRIYSSIANRVYKSSRRVSEYQLENLWN